RHPEGTVPKCRSRAESARPYQTAGPAIFWNQRPKISSAASTRVTSRPPHARVLGCVPAHRERCLRHALAVLRRLPAFQPQSVIALLHRAVRGQTARAPQRRRAFASAATDIRYKQPALLALPVPAKIGVLHPPSL